MAEGPTGPNPEQAPEPQQFTPQQEAQMAYYQRHFDPQRAAKEATGPDQEAPAKPTVPAEVVTETPAPEPTPSTPEATPAEPAVDTTAQAFAKQVEQYKTNLQRKFGQKALETGVSVMALAANVPGLKEISGYLSVARKVLGTATLGMLGGDLGRQLGLSNFSKEQGRKTAEFLERTKQFYHLDGTLRDLNVDELLAAEELRTELNKQLELSAAIAKTTEHHKLFGRLIEEDIDKTAPESKGWLKEMVAGGRALFSRETAKKVLALSGKVTPRNVASASWGIAKTGGRNWKSLAWAGVPLGAIWLAPVAAPAILTGTIGLNLYRKGGQLKELYKAHGEAEQRVRQYRQFSFEHVTGVNDLADQILKLDRALGRGEADVTTEQLLGQLQDSISEDTYRDIAKAVRQAAAAGAGAGLAAGAAMYTLLGHQHEQDHQPQQPVSDTNATTPISAGTPHNTLPNSHTGQPSANVAPSMSRASDEVPAQPFARPPLTAGNATGIEPAHPFTNTPAQPFADTNEPAKSWVEPNHTGVIPEHPHVGEHLKLDLHGDGKLTDFEVKQDPSGRLFIKLNEMDRGDGINHHIKLTPEELKRGVTGKYVKVFVDERTPNGGYLGWEMEVLRGNKEHMANVMWIGDKDDWMRHEVGEQTWNQVREHAKGSIGPDHHDTKGWGFVARHAPPASIDSGHSLAGLHGKELEQAVSDKVPEAQISHYDEAHGVFRGTWLGKHGFPAEFTNADKLSDQDVDRLFKGWPPELQQSLQTTQQEFFRSGSFKFVRFTVPSERLASFSKALVYHPSGLPIELKETLRGISANKATASEALLEVLRGKKELTLEQLIAAAKQAKQNLLARKG